MMSNEEIIERIKSGEKEFEQELYKNVEKLIVKTASQFYFKHKYLINSTCVDYDDIMQMARCGFIKSIYGFKSSKKILFSTYLVNTIQLSLYAEFYRNKKINNAYQKDLNKVEFEDNMSSYKPSNIDNKILLEQTMECLTEKEKGIIIDKYYKDLGVAELRNKYGLSTPAINNIKNRALKKMRVEMEK